MKKVNIFLLLIKSIAITLFCSKPTFSGSLESKYQNQLPDDLNPFITKEFVLDSTGCLNLKTSGGNINIIGTDGNVVKVEMFVRFSNGKKKTASQIEKALKHYDVQIYKEHNTVKVVAESKKWTLKSNNFLNISFTIYVPHEISTDLKTSGGSIKMNNVKGVHKAITSGGSITCLGVDGDLKANTEGGSIHVENYEGELDATTNGGTIILKNANGKLKVNTSGGGISLHDVSGNINAETGGGGITATILKPEQRISLVSSGGSIYATVPSTQGLDIDLQGNKVNTQLHNFYGRTERDKITGSINGGGIPLIINTTGGYINLTFKN